MLFGPKKSTVGTVKREIFGRIKGDAVRFSNENSISLFNRLEISCYEHPRTVKNVLKFSKKRPPLPQSPFLQCSLLKMIYFPFSTSRSTYGCSQFAEVTILTRNSNNFYFSHNFTNSVTAEEAFPAMSDVDGCRRPAAALLHPHSDLPLP